MSMLSLSQVTLPLHGELCLALFKWPRPDRAKLFGDEVYGSPRLFLFFIERETLQCSLEYWDWQVPALAAKAGTKEKRKGK